METVWQTAKASPSRTPAPRDAVIILLFLLAAALFLFLDPRTTPIVIWDESRNVVNALEMRQTGSGLITTYEFRPDLWNTKPPLLIWLMTGSMALFGPSEWALRLPSALAAMATLLILILFTRRVTGSLATALLAGGFLLLSPGFFGEGGARTADYDALLLFFTTAYLQLLFFAVHKRHPPLTALLLIGAAIAGATMTKTTAGLVPGAGVCVYLLLTRRVPRLLADIRGYAALIAVAAVPLLLFYLAREAAGPGYLAAAWHNDWLGRVGKPLTGQTTSPFLYLRELSGGWFAAGPLLFALPLAWRGLRGRSRVLMLYCLCTAGTLILLYSLATTRLLHYVLPAFPPLAIAAALTLRGLACLFLRPALSRPLLWAAGFAALLLFGQIGSRALYWRHQGFPDREFYPRALYGDVFAELSARGITRLTVVDDGFVVERKPHYVPLLRAYRLIWRERGLDVAYRPGLPALRRQPVASCDPQLALVLRAWGTNETRVPGCTVILPPGG